MKFITVILLIFLICSCNSDNEDKNFDSQEVSSDNISPLARITFDNDVKEVFKQDISYGEIRSLRFESNDYFFTEVLNSNGIVIGYVDENEGKYGVSDISSSYIHRYVDLKNQKEYIFDLNHSHTYNIIIPDFELFTNNQVNDMVTSGDNRCMGNFMLCTATASLAAIAIAASDGPLPFMDALAVTTFITANALCVSNYDLCTNPPKAS